MLGRRRRSGKATIVGGGYGAPDALKAWNL